jgi:hypothetical protein
MLALGFLLSLNCRNFEFEKKNQYYNGCIFAYSHYPHLFETLEKCKFRPVT